MTETILEEAQRRTSSDRPAVYGHPRLHFACTAAMVHAYLVRRGWTPPPGETLLPHDWAQIIGLDKTARQAGNLTATGKLHRDTSVDQAGYARTGEMLDEQPVGIPIPDGMISPELIPYLIEPEPLQCPACRRGQPCADNDRIVANANGE